MMIIVFMTLTVLSLLFVIFTAVRAIVVLDEPRRKDEGGSLIVSRSQEVDKINLSPFHNDLYAALLTYEFVPTGSAKSVLLNVENALDERFLSSFKESSDVQTCSFSQSEVKLKSLVKPLHADKLNAFSQLIEEIASEYIYKSLFFIELKMIQDKNFEGDNMKSYSEIYYCSNKDGGIRYGKY